MMIDCGTSDYSDYICNFLGNIGVKRIDCIIITHVHNDHTGGLESVLTQFGAEDVYIVEITGNQRREDQEKYKSIIENIHLKGYTVKKVNPIEYRTMDFYLSDAHVEFLGPVDDKYTDINNMSLVTKITFKEVSFLFPGDADHKELEDIRNKTGEHVFRATVLHSPHHGAETSNEYLFIKSVNPDYVIISVGRNNSYGHPDEKTLSVYRDLNRARGGVVKVMRTDESGTIICHSDGKTIDLKKNDLVFFSGGPHAPLHHRPFRLRKHPR